MCAKCSSFVHGAELYFEFAIASSLEVGPWVLFWNAMQIYIALIATVRDEIQEGVMQKDGKEIPDTKLCGL